MELLDKSVSNRICAENIIQDLISIVKELLENALDASATSITVTLNNNGFMGLEIQDNGHGIMSSEIPKMCSQGATSKLTSVNEIAKIKTLGFRGQALYAISRLCRLTLFSRHLSESIGKKAEFIDGSLETITSEPMNIGTTVKISNVFHNNPVRLTDLRNRNAYYIRKVIEIVELYALINYDIKICLVNIDLNNKRNILVHALTTNSLFEKLKHFIGSENFKNFSEYTKKGRCDYVFIVSNPSVPAKKKIQVFFLNKRLVEVPNLLKKSISNAFKDFTYNPSYVLAINIEKGYDVNVSVNKMQVFLEDEVEINAEITDFMNTVSREMARMCNLGTGFNEINNPKKIDFQEIATKRKHYDDEMIEKKLKSSAKLKNYYEVKSENPQNTLVDQTKKFQVDEDPIKSEIFTDLSVPTNEEPVKDQEARIEKNGGILQNYMKILHQSAKPCDNSVEKVSKKMVLPPNSGQKSMSNSSIILNFSFSDLLNFSDSQQSLTTKQKKSPGVATENLKSDPSLVFEKEDFSNLSIIGQFNKGFILAQSNQKLFIIDQHAADEKFLFETLQQSTEIHKQPLIIPKPVVMPPSDEVLFERYLKSFSLNGFTFDFYPENPSGHRYSITSFPLSKAIVFDVSDFFEMIENLKSVGCVDDYFSVSKLIRAKKFRNMFASRACRKAVMIGTAIEHRKMKEILENLTQIEHPWNCPHGRPTIRLLRELNGFENTRKKINFSLKK